MLLSANLTSQEGEAYFRCRTDPTAVVGTVVLARNPCHAATDVQLAQCVDLFARVDEAAAAGTPLAAVSVRHALSSRALPWMPTVTTAPVHRQGTATGDGAPHGSVAAGVAVHGSSGHDAPATAAAATSGSTAATAAAATATAATAATAATPQSVAAKWARWRELLVDVIVLSVDGAASLAQSLSGGDFDGDRVWICWEERIVNQLKRASVDDAVVAGSKATVGGGSGRGSSGGFGGGAAVVKDLVASKRVAGPPQPPPVASWNAADMHKAFVNSTEAYTRLSIASNLHLAWLDYYLSRDDKLGACECGVQFLNCGRLTLVYLSLQRLSESITSRGRRRYHVFPCGLTLP